MSAITAVVGIFILVVGIGAISLAREFHPFFILWIAVGVFIVGYHLVNALSGRAPATTIIESEDEPAEPKPVADRLRELDDLKQRQLVSDAEYEAKRTEILKDI
jgi:high-affinity Fe2+/Pb2+ permease